MECGVTGMGWDESNHPPPQKKAKIPPVMTFWYLATDLYPSLNLILSEAPKGKREKNNSVRPLEAATSSKGTWRVQGHPFPGGVVVWPSHSSPPQGAPRQLMGG